MPRSTDGQFPKTGEALNFLKLMHYTRVTKGPRDTFMAFCANPHCGVLALHDNYDSALVDIQWHKQEAKREEFRERTSTW